MQYLKRGKSMDDALRPARLLAESLRFSGDTLRPNGEGDTARTRFLTGSSLQNELQISPEVTPELANQLMRIRENLEIPDYSVHAFVYPSSEIQASCLSSSTSECVVRFSSSLVDLLEPEEFAFVCGHEIGHFLLAHGMSEPTEHDMTIEFFMAKRAQEISVDRLGLVACQSLDVSIRALMKTASGLCSRHLRFDVGRFISQLSKLPRNQIGQHHATTHPSILVRCRALLWFSLSEIYFNPDSSVRTQEVDEIDSRIQRDIDTYVDGHAMRQLEELKTNLAIWMAAERIVEDGRFEKSEQKAFAEMFGEEILESMRLFFSDTNPVELKRTIRDKVNSARSELMDFLPTRAQSEMEKIAASLANSFS